jgi:hypothetical protein
MQSHNEYVFESVCTEVKDTNAFQINIPRSLLSTGSAIEWRWTNHVAYMGA